MDFIAFVFMTKLVQGLKQLFWEKIKQLYLIEKQVFFFSNLIDDED